MVESSRDSWRKGVATVVITNGTTERRVASPSEHEVWFMAPDLPNLGWNNPRCALRWFNQCAASSEALKSLCSENRYTAQVRFANQSIDFDWLLAGDDDTIFLMDNVVDLVRDLDPNEPFYLTDALQSNGLSCTLREEASELGPSNCVKTPPVTPCTRAVLEDSSVCHADNPAHREGHVDLPPGNIWGFGQSGMLVSRGLLRSISEADMFGCEYCNVTDFCHMSNERLGVCNGGGCYGGGDVRLGECFWRFAENSNASVSPDLSHANLLSVAVLIVGQPKIETPLVFESIRARVLDRLRAKAHHVHVFLCEDPLTLRDKWTAMTLERVSPYERFAIDANSQLERNLKCYEKIAQHNFDWFVRTRPDLVLWDDVPDLEQLDDGGIHARLLSAVNISGLFIGSFNTAYDTERCNSDVCGRSVGCATCAVYEDQLAIVPRAAAHAYFHAFERLEGASEACWPTNGFPEGFFTRAVLRGDGRFVPLTLEARLWGRYDALHENVPVVDLRKNCT